MKHRQVQKDSSNKLIRGFFVPIFIGIAIFASGWAFGSGAVNIATLNKNNVQSQNEDLPDKLDYSSVDEVYDSIKKNFDGDLNTEQLLTGLKAGLADATGDPYTEYLDKDAAEEFDADLNGTFSGIGAELGKKDELITVISPISGFPAEKAGLKPQDIIAEINGESTFDMSLETAVNKIRGEAGTAVELKIVSENDERKTISITREDITIPSVESEALDNNIGYLRITRFANDTAQLSQEAAKSFKDQGVKSVILDVRGNPGGLVDASVDVASLWLNNGDIILQEKRGDSVIKTHKADGDGLLGGVKTVVLIDEGSASASEIIAGALKDNKAATLIGEDSFGKGSVQSLQPISSGGMLKITIARWFTPNDRNIDKDGISPDKKVEAKTGKNDTQLEAAKTYLRQEP